jgi:hypothetical protein
VRWASILRNRNASHRHLHQSPMEFAFGVGIVSAG